MKDNKTIILTGGGTAGHVMPNIALLPELKKYFSRICYIGTNGIEKEIAQKNNIEFFEIEAVKLVRKVTPKNLLIPFKLLKSIKTCKNIIKQINPDVIFSKGGYVSIPVAIAGKKCGINVISHESDLSMGLANKVISRYCKIVCTSFYETAKNHKKFVYTGSPIRTQIFNGNKNKIFEQYNFDNNKPTVLFLGGSLGSKAINDCVEKCQQELCQKYNVIHICGKNMNEKKQKNYLRLNFAHNIEDFFAASDIVVCRSGANTLFELLSINKPMLLVPLPKTQSRGDQIENAENFCKNNYAEMIYQENLTLQTLLEKIEKILKNKQFYINNQQKASIKNANKNIVDIIIKYTN